MKHNPKSGRTESGDGNDWRVVVSKGLEIVEVKEMGVPMKHTRLKPAYSSSGDLMMVIPGASEDEVEKKALDIARRIASAGLWGLDLLNLSDL